jgi:hypothetical protein
MADTVQVTNAPAWVAWRRRCRGRWRVVAEADTESAAWQALHAAMSQEKTGDWETMVLRAGERP